MGIEEIDRERPSLSERFFDITFKPVMGIICLTMFYFAGGQIYNSTHSSHAEISRLEKQKTELTRNMDEWQEYIPLMGNPEDSLRYGKLLNIAKADTTTINRRLEGLYETRERVSEKSFYSWAAFLMGEEK